MIVVQNLNKSFADKTVLNDISFKVEDGTIYGLIGKNGAGKTTLITIIAGLQDADSGKCLINGKLICKGRHDNLTGYLPDIPSFFDHLSVGEYMDFLFAESAVQRKKNLLDLVGLSDKTMIKTMSRGMKQRLGLASVLVHNPPVLLLDEPTSALDPQGRYELSQILTELKSQGKSILLSTHILSDMEKICDHVGFLNHGRIAHSLCPNELIDSNSFHITFASSVCPEELSGPGIHIVRQAETSLDIQITGDTITSQQLFFSKLQKLSVPVVSIDTHRVSLDSVFQEVCT